MSSLIDSVLSRQKHVLLAWLLAALIPVAFAIWLFTMVIYAAPEYDDFYFSWYMQDGLIHTVLSSYFGFQGRVLPFVMMQVPNLISKQIGIGILPSYSITLAIYMLALVGGCAFAIVRAWDNLPFPVAVFIVFTFVSLFWALRGTYTIFFTG
jgi:hypothetical protein